MIKLNRYLRESLDIDGHFGGLRGVTAPQEGIRFQRPAITTTAGKGYGKPFRRCPSSYLQLTVSVEQGVEPAVGSYTQPAYQLPECYACRD